MGCRLCHRCLFQNSNNQHRRCNEKRSCVQLKTCNTVVVSLGSTKKVANAIFIDAYEATDQDLLVCNNVVVFEQKLFSQNAHSQGSRFS